MTFDDMIDEEQDHLLECARKVLTGMKNVWGIIGIKTPPTVEQVAENLR